MPKAGTESTYSARNMVWDQWVAGSNPATPTTSRTDTRTDTAKIARIRDIITEWNWGPFSGEWDRAALDAIFEIVGDNIQNDATPNA